MKIDTEYFVRVLQRLGYKKMVKQEISLGAYSMVCEVDGL